ncbi:BTAD domain-containing putative transcriptional regulator [Intrasporangium sp.]|uniref:AfsR/SARP family transcriptional regulator n=1 Tax=Intrasporangium sp. TaxID=1925024 RepID=UPI0029395D9D|nr:BTAD domain-containing putative transcriptional regulator [Intrasporangium sp.]MDV3222035.1 hypothetical protein [Intrasporangium sp.]
MSGRACTIRLLGHWRLDLDGKRAEVGSREQRVTALLGLRGSQPRAAVAGTLWPDSTDVRARANLRTSLHRLRDLDPGLVRAGRASVALGPQVLVDVWPLLDRLEQVERLPGFEGCHDLDGAVPRDPLDLHACLATLAGPDLLPGWYDDWVLFERERLHHRRIRALEKIAALLLERGDTAMATCFAEEAVALEPLLESAVALVMRAGLDAGNTSAAIHAFQKYRARLDAELGIPPSRELVELLATRPLARARR